MYKREFGFVLRGRDIVVDDVRVRAVGRSCLTHSHQLPRAEGDPQPTEVSLPGSTSCPSTLIASTYGGLEKEQW